MVEKNRRRYGKPRALATAAEILSEPDTSPARRGVDACARDAFAAIGFSISSEFEQILMGAIDEHSCLQLAHTIESCLASQGHAVPALSATFLTLHANNAVVTLKSLVDAILKLLRL